MCVNITVTFLLIPLQVGYIVYLRKQIYFMHSAKILKYTFQMMYTERVIVIVCKLMKL